MKRVLFLILVGLVSCHTENSKNTSKNTITFRTFGDWRKEIPLFDDTKLKCTCIQMIDAACETHVYVHFTSKSNTEVQITNVTGWMKWLQNGKIVPSTFLLSHITPIINTYNDNIEDSSHVTGKFISEKFRTLYKIHDCLLYDIEFSDPNYGSTPNNVDKVITGLEFDLTSNEGIKHYKKIYVLDKKTHTEQIPEGRND